MARSKKKSGEKEVTKKIELKQDKNLDKFEDDLAKFLEKEAGVEVAGLSEKNFVPYLIDTGNYALNWICSHDFFGGLPGTKAILLEGENSKGKSLLGAKLLGENVIGGGSSWYFDTEDAANYNFVSQIVGSKEVAAKIKRIDQVHTIEQLNKAMSQMINFQIAKGSDNAKRVMALVDSYSQLSSEKEVKAAEKAYDPKKEDARDMTKAQKSREGLRAITSKFFAANMTPIYIAHVTKNIGVMFGDPNVPATHGSMLLYTVSLRLSLTSSKDIQDPKYPIPVGVRLRIRTVKNRSVHKGKVCELDLYFKDGVDRFSGLVKLLRDYKIVDCSADPTPTSKVKYDDFEFPYRDVSKVVASFKEKGRDLLNEWNEKLRDIVEFREASIPEEEYLKSEDDIEDVIPEEIFNEEG